MAFIPLVGAAEIAFKFIMNSHQAIITLGVFGVESLDDPALLTPIGEAVASWWDDHLSYGITTSVVPDEVSVVALDSASASGVVVTSFVAGTGRVAAPPVYDNVALVMSFQTGRRGRSYRGRNYLPGASSTGTVDPSHFSAAYANSFLPYYEAFAAAMEALDLQHVVLSQFTAGAPRTVRVATPVSGYAARTKFGTMRRRVLGTGV